MPTISIQVAASTDDARNNSGNGTFNATAVNQHLGVNAGIDYWNGFRWLNVTVPQGATIISATLDLFSSTTGTGGSVPCIFYGEASDNAATFANSTPGKPEGRTRTSASVNKTFTASAWAALGFSVDPILVTTLVQEIVNRPGWTSGNSMAIVGHDNGAANNNYIGNSTYDSNPGRGATLTIEYTTGSTPDAPTGLTAVENAGDVDLSWSDASSIETGFVVERKRGASPNFYLLASLPPDTASFTDTDADPGYTYTYRVKATGADGDSAFATSSEVTMSGTKAWTSRISGWIYPAQLDAQNDLIDGRVMYSAKPEFATVDESGVFSMLTAGAVNDYSDSTMIARAKAYSHKPFFTISAGHAGTAALTANSTKRDNCTAGILDILTATDFAGVELDWEGFGDWTATDYANYKSYLSDLCTAVHAAGKEVMVCGPPIGNATEQGYYEWQYEDFETIPVDYLIPMAYDWNFDFGAGTPTAPTARVRNVCKWMRQRISDLDRIVMGMPNYGHYGPTGGWPITNITKAQAAARTGYPGTRDPNSEEMIFASSGISTVYNDTTGINTKREIIEDEGIRQISVWHLGDNDWFSGKAEITNPEPPASPDSSSFFAFF